MNMKPVFKDLSFADIFEPGQCYLLIEESSRDADLVPLEHIYVIQKEEQIVEALEIEMNIILLAMAYEVLAFAGVKRKTKDCHEFKMFCYDRKKQKTCYYRLYLQRLRSVEEEREKAEESFEDDD